MGNSSELKAKAEWVLAIRFRLCFEIIRTAGIIKCEGRSLASGTKAMFPFIQNMWLSTG